MIDTRPSLDAQVVLRALRALGLPYRPDATVLDGAWIATCPACRITGALRITEREDVGPVFVGGGAVSVGCRRRCRPPGAIATILLTDADLLAAQAETARAYAEIARLRAFASWVVDSYRRSMTSQSDNTTLARGVAA